MPVRVSGPEARVSDFDDSTPFEDEKWFSEDSPEKLVARTEETDWTPADDFLWRMKERDESEDPFSRYERTGWTPADDFDEDFDMDSESYSGYPISTVFFTLLSR